MEFVEFCQILSVTHFFQFDLDNPGDEINKLTG